MDEEEYTDEDELTSRPPTPKDLADLCRLLNESETRYPILGGFTIRGAGYSRETMDLDFLIATDLENEAKVYAALEFLPDKAVRERKPGEIDKYTVIRVGDEICIDLMASASGIRYEEAMKDQIIRTVNGVHIPFASPRLLYRMKEKTRREKDRADLQFLRNNYADEIFNSPPENEP